MKTTGVFRDMAEQWPGAVLIVNREGTIRWLNEAARDWVPAVNGAEGQALRLGALDLPWLREGGDLAAVLEGGMRRYPPRVALDRHGRERYCGARFTPLRRGRAIFGAMLCIEDAAAPEGSTVVQASTLSDTARAVALSAAQVGAWYRDLQSGAGGVDAQWCAALDLDACAGADHGARWEKLIHPDDLAEYRAGCEELAQGAVDSFELEYRVLTKSSRWLWLLQRGRLVEHDSNGRPLRAAGICIEIDARKRAEVALQEKESRLATALWGARAAFWRWNITSDVQLRSAMWFAMTGYQREEWEGEARPWHSRLHPEDVAHVERTIRDHFEGRTQSLELEYRIRVASGEYRWFQDRGRVNEWDFQGNPTVAIGVSLDIESQKQAEIELLRTEGRLETALWGANIGLWELDFVSGRIRWHNDWCARLGLDPCEGEEHLRRWFANVHADDVEALRHAYDAHLAGRGPPVDVEYRVRARGEWRWVTERARVVARAADGAPLRMVGVCGDIEARTSAARSAIEERQRLEYAIEVARIGVWHWNVLDGRFRCNDLYAQYAFGGPCPEDAATRRAARRSRVHPDDVPEASQLDREIRDGTRNEFEIQCRLRDAQGEWRWVLQRGRVTARTPDGSPADMAGFLVDVTHRHEETAARIRAVATLHAVTEHTPDYLVLLDRDLRIRFANRGWGPFRIEELPGRHVLECVNEENRQVIGELYTGTLQTGEPGERKVEKADADGNTVHLVHRVAAVRENGVITGLTVAVTNVTARHRAEERSRATESVLHTIAEVTSDWLVMLDQDLRFVFINRGFGGHEPRRIIGRTLDEFSPQQLSGSVRALAEGVLRSGKARTEEQEFVRPDGVPLRFELRARPVHAVPGGAGHGVVITATDITARKALEREILEIANREQQRMGSDLHDGLSQDLTGIALMLRGVAGQLRKERSEARADVEDVIGLVNAAIESTRVLATGLSPVSAERGGLVAALEALAARMQDRHGVAVEIATQLDAPLRLADGALNHLYRIAQEGVINAVRHGSPKQVRLELAVDAERVRLRVLDDGRGFAAPAATPAGLGLRIMRYRAQMLDGELSIGPNGAQGVVVECICPVAGNRRAAAS
ncbi:MAG: PAS domain-containing protein [Steroidobacteraceae bacterium]|nr:PAS domain-containing protein [Steroidobacteraceae bacterium]